MNSPSEEEVDRLERKLIEATKGSPGSSRRTRGECMHCQKVVVRLPDSVREEMEHDGHGINVVGGVG